jgi:arylsulfatase A-like enzyme
MQDVPDLIPPTNWLMTEDHALHTRNVMPEPKRPNVILISTDQHRADTLGVAGHPCVYTPGIDAMAMSGHYFQRAVAEAPSCVASRRTLWTDPIHHGMIV